MKYKGLYIIDDSRFIESNWGPSTHILKGMKEMGKYFDIQLFVLNHITENKTRGNNKEKKNRNNNIIIGTLRDLYKILISLRHTIKVYKYLKSHKINFVYERSQYLSFSTLVATKLLKIPHFYEKNWVEYAGIKQFYPSLVNSVVKYLEEISLRNSTHIFFIGNQNKYYSGLKKNWSIVQNAADINDFNMELIQLKNNSVNAIEMCFVANLMDHHRFDIFLSALNILISKYDFNQEIHLYLYGRNFDDWLYKIPSKIKVTYCGSIEKEKLISKISKHHIGIISGGPSYSSFMKLYDYAAAKLIVICPELENLQSVFKNDCIIYFKNNNAESLAEIIYETIQNYNVYENYADNLYNHVLNNFTWEKIFSEKKMIISSYIK